MPALQAARITAAAWRVSTAWAADEAERASFRVAADRPPLARVDDLASELDHPY